MKTPILGSSVDAETILEDERVKGGREEQNCFGVDGGVRGRSEQTRNPLLMGRRNPKLQQGRWGCSALPQHLRIILMG